VKYTDVSATYQAWLHIKENEMTQSLERAIAIAAGAHEGQLDKGGAPYILHPLRVMLKVGTLEERIVAVLHDVVEDCDISLEELAEEGFSETVLAAIESVTRVPGEAYEDFIARAAQNPIGRVVKLADLEENSDLSRIVQPGWEDLERIEKYRRAIGVLR
jgi:(p)ppGpp synthase/HD superfamily hydrolase